MLDTEVTVGPDIPDVSDTEDQDTGVVEEENIEISHSDLADTLIVAGPGTQLVHEQQTAALNLHQLQVADGHTVTISNGEVLTHQSNDLVQQAAMQDALVSDVQLHPALNQQVSQCQTLLCLQ
jgi:hypothetical protein